MANEEIVTIMAADVTFDGNARIEGGMSINGRVSGEVVCSGTLTIGREANIEANLRAEDIIIAGIVVGSAEAKSHLTLGNTAKFQGEIRAAALIVEEGAALKGSCYTENSNL